MMRGEVRRFGREMERKLAIHDKKRGAGGWKIEDVSYLLHRLRTEVVELEQVINTGGKPPAILSEAADVGNFAMMIADVAGNLMESKKQAFPVEDCKRYRIEIDGENFYLLIGDNFVSATVPFENSKDRQKLRTIVKDLCDGITKALGGELLEEENGV